MHTLFSHAAPSLKSGMFIEPLSLRNALIWLLAQSKAQTLPLQGRITLYSFDQLQAGRRNRVENVQLHAQNAYGMQKHAVDCRYACMHI